MASNIRVKKECEFCKTEFVAKTIHTRYCSHTCNQKHYKELKKKEKLEKAKKGSGQKIIPNDSIYQEVLQSKSFLTVQDTAQLLKMSTKTVYRLINEGQLNAVNFGLRKTMIRRNDLELLFDESLVAIQERKKDKKWNRENCYSIGEISEVYHMSTRAIASLIQRLSLETKQTGKFVYVQKSEIDSIFNP